MSTTTKIVLVAIAGLAVFAIARSDTSPQRMAEVEVNACYRALPPSNDIFRHVERHNALKRCKAMKEMYVKTYGVAYTNN